VRSAHYIAVGIVGAVFALTAAAYRPAPPVTDLDLHIVVNLPAYRLDALVGDSVVSTMRVAVGMPRYPTPRGEFEITSIDWNPRWVPPSSPWAAKEKPMAPGPNNPMGRVKLNFRPLYFLHGTPFGQSIGSAASHGCIRLRNEDAIALALLVQRFGALRLTSAASEALAVDPGSHTVQLDAPVAITLRYDLVEIAADSVRVYPDIYHLSPNGLRAEVYGALARAGLDTQLVNETRLGTLVSRLGRGGRAAPIETLLRGPRDSSYMKSGAR
jgi:murein L,D-transpeptidase YcbB/YkuD